MGHSKKSFDYLNLSKMEIDKRRAGFKKFDYVGNMTQNRDRNMNFKRHDHVNRGK